MARCIEYTNFDITITRAHNEYLVHASCELLGEALATLNATSLIARWTGDLMPPLEDGQPIGEALFAALFHRDIHTHFLLCQQLAQERELGLRVRLRLATVPELATIPWEFLYGGQPARFLATDDESPIVRYLELPQRIEPLAVKYPLRILAVLGASQERQPLDTDREWRQLETALEELQRAGRVVLTRLDHATRATLRACLRTTEFHILHFLGHGHFDPQTKQSGLLFEGDAGQVDLVTAEELARLLASQRSLRMVFLNACNGAQADGIRSFSGTAQALVQQGLPAVIAMQFAISDSAALWVSQQFYRLLADGYPVDRALTQARLAITDAHPASNEWATPVLFMRAQDGFIVYHFPTCPYPGMRAFSEAESEHFYGRTLEIAQLQERLRLNRLVVVIGPSGSGKSSLVFAGLAPQLRTSKLFGGADWVLLNMRPGSEPVKTLETTLAGHVDVPNWQRHHAEQCLLLVIDQFEEALTLAAPEATKHLLEHVVRLHQLPNTYVILTMRADFFGELMSLDAWEMLKDRRMEVPPLKGQPLRLSIVEPARTACVQVEEALVQRLLVEAGQEPGALPFVQETMLLLWDQLVEPTISLRAYEQLLAVEGDASSSGLQRAMVLRANQALIALRPAEREIARRLFLSLVQFGEGREDTRRQRTERELINDIGDEERVTQIINHFVQSRLLTSTSDDAGNARIDLAHEALLRGWPDFQRWRNEDRVAELFRRRMESEVEQWQKEGDLLQGQFFEAALAWAERYPNLVAPQMQALLTQSKTKRDLLRRRERRRTTFTTTLVTIVVLFLGPALFLAANIWMFNLRRISAWQPTSFPANPVTTIAVNAQRRSPNEPLICVGTADIGVGCSVDGETWNLYQAGLPTGSFSTMDDRSKWWGALTGSVWSTKIRTVAALTFDAAEPQRLLALTNIDGLYERRNDEASWRQVSASIPVTQVQELTVAGEFIAVLRGTGRYAANEIRGKVYMSRDGGLTWQISGGQDDADIGLIYDIAFLFGEHRAPQGVVFAADSGLLFQSLAAPADSQIHPIAPLYESTDDSKTILIFAATDELYWVAATASERAAKEMSYTIYRGVWKQAGVLDSVRAVRVVQLSALPFRMAVLPVDDGECQQPPCQRIWLALANSDVVVLEPSGELRDLGKRPTWVPILYDLRLLPYPSAAQTDYLLLLGHRDGLIHFCPSLDDPFYRCIGDAVSSSSASR